MSGIPPRKLLGVSVVCFVLAIICLALILTGCSSPTAPSSTQHLTWAAAPGCSPGPMPNPLPAGPALATVQLTGSTVLQAFWPTGNGGTWQVTFHQYGQTYLVCEVKQS